MKLGRKLALGLDLDLIQGKRFEVVGERTLALAKGLELMSCWYQLCFAASVLISLGLRRVISGKWSC